MTAVHLADIAGLSPELRAQLEAAGAKPTKRRKFGNEPVDGLDGHFDSSGEYARWCELRLLERAGQIANLRRQVRFPLDVNGRQVAIYFADFCYSDPTTGKMTVEDFKGGGVRTAVYRLKKRMLFAQYSLEILET